MRSSRKTKHLRSKKNSPKQGLLTFAVVFAIIGSLFLFRSFAADTTPYTHLSPSSATLSQGQNFSLQLRLNNSGGRSRDINCALQILTFPASKLAVNSISTQNSYYQSVGTNRFDNSQGTIDLSLSNGNGDGQGDVLMATLNFTAKSSGQAFIGGGGSTINSCEGPDIGHGFQGATYTIIAPPPPPPPPTTVSLAGREL